MNNGENECPDSVQPTDGGDKRNDGTLRNYAAYSEIVGQPHDTSATDSDDVAEDFDMSATAEPDIETADSSAAASFDVISGILKNFVLTDVDLTNDEADETIFQSIEEVIPPKNEDNPPPITEDILPSVTEDIPPSAAESVPPLADPEIISPTAEDIASAAAEDIISPATENKQPPAAEPTAAPAQGRAAPPRRKRRRRRGRLRRLFSGMLFLLPGFAGFCVFYIWPFCVSLYYSLLSRPVNGAFVGIKNYTEMFQNVAYLKGLANTVRFIGISVPLNMAFSLGIAMMIQGLARRKELFTLIFLIPLVIPSGSTVTFWKALLARDGALNGILFNFGVDKINWLDSNLTFWVIVVIFTWKNLGFNMVLYLSGLGNIPKEYYEAAWVDGAGPFQLFRKITLPQLAASSVLVLILSIVNSFKVFKEIYLITGSYPHESIYTLQHFMNNMFASLNYPKLTTATTILVVLIAVLTQGLLRLERRAATD